MTCYSFYGRCKIELKNYYEKQKNQKLKTLKIDQLVFLISYLSNINYTIIINKSSSNKIKIKPKPNSKA